MTKMMIMNFKLSEILNYMNHGYVRVLVYTGVCLCICVCISVYVCVLVYIGVCLCICVCISVYVCVLVYIGVCLCMCIFVYDVSFVYHSINGL